MDIAKAILLALRDFREQVIEPGWPTAGGDRRKPDQVWIDARYKSQGVYAFVRESGPRYRAAMGCGSGPQYEKGYSRPKQTGKEIRFIGEEYHVVWFAEERIWVVEVNADHWKSWFHRRLKTPLLDEENQRAAGALTLYESTDKYEHTRLAKQWTAEKEVEEFVAGRGTVRRWVRLSRANHHLDNAYNCCAAGHFLGIRLIAMPQRAAVDRPRPGVVHRLGGSALSQGERPFLISERNRD
jgi:hypothetical protein